MPSCLQALTKLTTLDISKNQISHLPFWLAKLPLTSLKASGNPLQGEQLAALNKEIAFFRTSNALLAYLRTSEQRVPQRHVLLTVLGHFMAVSPVVILRVDVIAFHRGKQQSSMRSRSSLFLVWTTEQRASLRTRSKTNNRA